MGKSLKYGSHSFPSASGFTGSTGKVASIKPYTRRVGVPKAATTPKPGAPVPKLTFKDAKAAGAAGPALQPRTQAISQLDKVSGGTSALLPGYKKGGPVKGGGRC